MPIMATVPVAHQQVVCCNGANWYTGGHGVQGLHGVLGMHGYHHGGHGGFHQGDYFREEGLVHFDAPLNKNNYDGHSFQNQTSTSNFNQGPPPALNTNFIGTNTNTNTLAQGSTLGNLYDATKKT